MSVDMICAMLAFFSQNGTHLQLESKCIRWHTISRRHVYVSAASESSTFLGSRKRERQQQTPRE